MTATRQERTVLTVGQVAEQLGVTVRTLHHYDEIGLVSPAARSGAGYRLYAAADMQRLQQVVVYRRLGFSLAKVLDLLDDEASAAAVVEHLRRQREAVMSRLVELGELVTAIDRALEREMTGIDPTPEQQRELFGDGFRDEYAAEAEERWGETDAWRQSRERTSRYTTDDWTEVRAETDAINAAFAAALDAGLPAYSEVAMDAAERARQQITDRFYDCSPALHRSLGDMYVTDPRFTRTYDDVRPGLAQYVRDAIHANADRWAEPAAP